MVNLVYLPSTYQKEQWEVTEFQTCFETSISERILSHLIVNAIDDPEFLGGGQGERAEAPEAIQGLSAQRKSKGM